MKKIVIIDHEPLTIRRRQIFYIDELRAAGFDVEFWDCSQYFHPGIVLADMLNQSYITKLNSLEQIRTKLDQTDVESTYFVIETFDNWTNRHFFALLSKRKCRKIKIELYATAGIADISLFRKLLSSTPGKLINATKNRIKSLALIIYKKIHKVADFDTVISSGNSPKIDIHINHPDWELLRSAEPYDNQGSAYSIFLDEYFPLHPDLIYFEGGRSSQVDAEVYQKSMRTLFAAHKQRSSLQIIVAAHPKSQYGGSEFGEIEILKYKTANLIKGCQSVFVHASASVAFAIMADKPIAFIVTDDYVKTTDTCFGIKRISEALGLPIFNIDCADLRTVIPVKISPEAREKYIYSYLTSKGTEDKSNAEILINFFRSGAIG